MIYTEKEAIFMPIFYVTLKVTKVNYTYFIEIIYLNLINIYHCNHNIFSQQKITMKIGTTIAINF